ncbi:unnamed protein product [Effrenium voratum]|uniref:Uncharacterized protein n=1 Tax=Effrenium voratum TaxID=2562239 RepID=A0AA36JAM2_9DINO|nr:unnamed protein product [Effrenium voratum]CAJ1420918.1 unnamed protein product [Effrenium voratum]
MASLELRSGWRNLQEKPLVRFGSRSEAGRARGEGRGGGEEEAEQLHFGRAATPSPAASPTTSPRAPCATSVAPVVVQPVVLPPASRRQPRQPLAPQTAPKLPSREPNISPVQLGAEIRAAQLRSRVPSWPSVVLEPTAKMAYPAEPTTFTAPSAPSAASTASAASAPSAASAAVQAAQGSPRQREWSLLTTPQAHFEHLDVPDAQAKECLRLATDVDAVLRQAEHRLGTRTQTPLWAERRLLSPSFQSPSDPSPASPRTPSDGRAQPRQKARRRLQGEDFELVALAWSTWTSIRGKAEEQEEAKAEAEVPAPAAPAPAPAPVAPAAAPVAPGAPGAPAPAAVAPGAPAPAARGTRALVGRLLAQQEQLLLRAALTAWSGAALLRRNAKESEEWRCALETSVGRTCVRYAVLANAGLACVRICQETAGLAAGPSAPGGGCWRRSGRAAWRGTAGRRRRRSGRRKRWRGESFAWTTGERDAASHRRHERLQARRPRRLLRQVRRCLRAGSLVRGIAKL